ncbi:hypothetical protein ALC62_01419, partial [Cyphomyrmex costatus]
SGQSEIELHDQFSGPPASAVVIRAYNMPSTGHVRFSPKQPGEERLPVPLMGHRLIAWNARIRPQPKKSRERQKKTDESSVTEDRGFFCEFYASRSSSGAVHPPDRNLQLIEGTTVLNAIPLHPGIVRTRVCMSKRTHISNSVGVARSPVIASFLGACKPVHDPPEHCG